MERTGLTGAEQFETFIEMRGYTSDAKIVPNADCRYAVWANELAWAWAIYDLKTGRSALFPLTWTIESLLGLARELNSGHPDTRVSAEQMRSLGLKPIPGINRSEKDG